jgi:hypothetical protein
MLKTKQAKIYRKDIPLWKGKKLSYEFHPTWDDFAMYLSVGSYFSRRLMLHFYVSQVFFLAMLIIGACRGYEWWWYAVCTTLFFFGNWGSVFLKLPVYTKYDQCDPPAYGMYFHGNAIWVKLGGKKNHWGEIETDTRRLWTAPWEWTWVRTSVWLADQTWAHETKGHRQEFYNEEWKQKIYFENHPYLYVLKSGDVQERVATCHIKEREWRWKGATWCPWIKKVRRDIEVDFNDEVGERTGSWKGGTTGCSYEMKEGETLVQTLRRMEVERKFN